MTLVLINFILTLIMLGAYTIMALRKDGWRKYVGPSTLGIVCLLSLALLTSSLGTPRPEWSLISSQQLRVVAIQYDINKAIYVWCYAPGSTQPVAISIPWDTGMASKIAQQQQKAKGSGGTMMLGDPNSTDPITLTQDPTPNKTE